MSPAEINAWIMLISLTLYVLLGGADFGAGVWDLLTTGKTEHRRAVRRRISDAIGPIWEANHVWLILVVVLMFTCFPRAFAALMTALHVPITLMLLGIVMRGSSFVFRKYSPPEQVRTRRRWGRVFAHASLITPVLLGVSLGTAATGDLRFDEQGIYTGGFFAPWLQPFPWAVGCFTLAIFAFLAAVYLCAEMDHGSAGDEQPAAQASSERPRPRAGPPLSTETGTEDGPARSKRRLLVRNQRRMGFPAPPMREAFRLRALLAAVAVGVTAGLTWMLALHAAPELSEGLARSWWTVPLQLATGSAAVGAIATLWFRRFVLARACAVLQVTLIVLGYGAAMFPHLVVPQFTIHNTAAPPETQWLVIGALACGTVILLPSLWYLFRTFKGARVFSILE